MARARIRYFCTSCGYESPRWLGRCPGCREWNSLVEEPVPSRPAGRAAAVEGAGPVSITRVGNGEEARLGTGLAELDRVLGGGLVPGSLVLLGGEPGIGKSTLLLQLSCHVASGSKRVLYVAGEESTPQVRLRAERLGCVAEGLYLLPETDLERVEGAIVETKPALVVVDSIQTMQWPELPSAPGSVGQVRECAGRLLRLAKTTGTPVVLVGHINKAGALAGPKVLEHCVDAVLYFEGERHHAYRLLRAAKNRFGSTNEIGLFEMTEGGLVEVPNPSEVLLAERPVGVAGSVVVASLEGTRPLLVEVQALVAPAGYGMPRRMATGVDYHRFSLLLAVLEKRVGLPLANQDAYLKVAGGLRVDEPSTDLGIAVAVASSFRDEPSHPRTVVMGEVGLGGEVRAVIRAGDRISEARRLGFTRCILPAANLRQQGNGDLEVVGVDTVAEGIAAALRPGWR